MGFSNSLQKILDQKNEKIFLVSGNLSFEKMKKDFPILKELCKKSTIFNQFTVNPKWEEIEKGLKIFNQNKFDIIIAIGGGSVIDAAKIIKYYSNKSNASKFIAIPTTAGSGSESTHFAVIYKKGIKSSLSDHSIKPDIVILDEVFLKYQSLNQLSVSALDAFSQSIESIWSKDCTNKSFDFAIKGFENSYLGLKSICSDKIDYRRLLKGSNLSGKAINLTKTTAAHAISYYFTSKYDLTHGFSVAYTIPFFMVENFNHTQKNKIIEDRYNKIIDFLGVQNINEGAKKIFKLILNLPLEKKLVNFDFSTVTLEEIKRNVNEERLNNNPCRVNFKELKKYFNDPLRWLEN